MFSLHILASIKVLDYKHIQGGKLSLLSILKFGHHAFIHVPC